MNVEAAYSKLLHGQNLNRIQSKSLFLELFEGRLPPSNAKAILLLLAKKGETSQELLGCVQALQQLEPPLKSDLNGLIDTCGTGGDKSHSLNISTLAAFIIAGGGGSVAKHGNHGLSSKCGSSDLMKALGVRIEAPPKRMIRSIQKEWTCCSTRQ